jgi:hypothetical protein
MFCSVAHAQLMARDPIDAAPPEWQRWLAQARAANEAAGVRAVLLQRKRVLVHWLEGTQAALAPVWQRMESDPQQACVVPLFDGQLAAPTDWVREPLTHVGAERDEILDIVRDMQRERNQSDGLITGAQPQSIATLLVLLDTSLHFAFTHTLKSSR